MTSLDSKKLFFGKAHDYSMYRPGYPDELFKILRDKYGLNSDSIVCELGAGTGKFSKLVSAYCSKVFSVEPNKDMREEGIKNCEGTCVSYIDGSAEDTNLDSDSVSFVFAVQSFHWFNKETTKEEVRRILKKDGLFAIVWNDWEDKDNEFSVDYFKLISSWKERMTGEKFQHKNVDDRKRFFKDSKYETETVIHSKKYSLKELIGLTKSLSYAPSDNNPLYDEFINEVIKIFNKYSVDDTVTFDFHTEMFIGRV